MFNEALLACDTYASESVVCSATGKTTSKLCYCLVAQSRQATRHIVDLITSRCKECTPESRPSGEFKSIVDTSFVASEVLVTLIAPPPPPFAPIGQIPVPHLDVNIQPLPLAVTATQSTRVLFSASARHSTSQGPT